MIIAPLLHLRVDLSRVQKGDFLARLERRAFEERLAAWARETGRRDSGPGWIEEAVEAAAADHPALRALPGETSPKRKRGRPMKQPGDKRGEVETFGDCLFLAVEFLNAIGDEFGSPRVSTVDALKLVWPLFPLDHREGSAAYRKELRRREALVSKARRRHKGTPLEDPVQLYRQHIGEVVANK